MITNIPLGYALVPRIPTEEMLKAAQDGDDAYCLRAFGKTGVMPQGAEDHWSAMLRAAPTPPVDAVPGEPVAWREHVEKPLWSWRQSFVNKHGDQLALEDFMDRRSLDDLIDYVLDESADPRTKGYSQ